MNASIDGLKKYDHRIDFYFTTSKIRVSGITLPMTYSATGKVAAAAAAAAAEDN
jgi:hypothetical protein